MARSRVGGRGAAGRGCARLRQAPRLVLGVLGGGRWWWWARWAGRCTEGVVVHLELPQTPARKSGWVAMLKLKLSVLTLSQRLVTPRTPRLSGATYSDCQRYPSTISGVPSNNY